MLLTVILFSKSRLEHEDLYESNNYSTYEELNRDSDLASNDSKLYPFLTKNHKQFAKINKFINKKKIKSEALDISSDASSDEGESFISQSCPRSSSAQECLETLSDLKYKQDSSKLQDLQKYILNRSKNGKNSKIFEPEDDLDVSDLKSQSTYNPERDFYYTSDHQPCNFDTNSALMGLSRTGRRHMPPQSNKYNSLLRQQHLMSESSTSNHRYPTPNPPQQFQQSPVSTRLYFNFNDSSKSQSNPYQNPFYNSLRYNSAGWTARAINSRRSSSPQPEPSTALMRTFNNNTSSNITTSNNQTNQLLANGYRRSESSNIEPPEYHRIFEQDH